MSLLILGLYEFAKNKTIVSGLAFSNDGKKFATLSTDRKVLYDAQVDCDFT